MDNNIRNRIKDLSSESSKEWKEEVEYLVNTGWLDYSSQIARRILALLKSKDLTQVELAQMLGVTAQRVNTIVKGRENLTLEVIYNLSQALQNELIAFPEYEYSKIIKKASPSNADNIVINIDATTLPSLLPDNYYIWQKDVSNISSQNEIGNLEYSGVMMAV